MAQFTKEENKHNSSKPAHPSLGRHAPTGKHLPPGDHKCTQNLIKIELDDKIIFPAHSLAAQERKLAIDELLECNEFFPVGQDGSTQYLLSLSSQHGRLIFDIKQTDNSPLVTHVMSITPFRTLIKDYFLICESYYGALKSDSSARVEAIDMARRGVHDDGARLLTERLNGKVEIGFQTARKLFTLIATLFWKGPT